MLAPLLILATARAHALEVGYCDTPERLSNKVAAEGHKIIAQMDRVGVSVERGGVRHDVAEFITATPDLTRWYLVGGDEPLSKRSSRMCVKASGRSLEVNDYRRDGPPTVTQYQFDRQKALAGCQAWKTQKCNELSEGIRFLAKEFGVRVALQGATDGGALIVILANPDATPVVKTGTHNYDVLAVRPTGAAVIDSFGINFSFSPWALGVLDRLAARPSSP